MISNYTVPEDVLFNSVPPRVSFQRRLYFAGASLFLWYFPSAGLLDKFIPHSLILPVCSLAALGIMTGIELLCWNLRQPKPYRSKAPFAVLAVLAAPVLFFSYRLSHDGRVGPGSDRADALNVGVRLLLHGAYPYHAHTYLGNPITPMPGALLLAAPFYLLGTAVIQNILWTSLFLVFLWQYFRSSWSGIFYFLVFFLLCPACIQDYLTGGDYCINTIYVLLAFYWVAHTHFTDKHANMRIASMVFLAVTLCSRPTYVTIVAPVISALVLQQQGKRALFQFLLICGLVATVLVMPFYFFDPPGFSPLQTAKFNVYGIPTWLHADALIPLVAILVSCRAFFIKLDMTRIFGMAALAFAAMFIPICLLFFFLWGWNQKMLVHWYYASPLTIFGGVWLIKTLELRAMLSPTYLPQKNEIRSTLCPTASVTSMR
jgi:hypothetical protein